MNKKRLFTLSALASAMMLGSPAATAAGFQLNAQSATGLGRAFAGDAVIADNASSMARNAATLSLFDAPQLSLGVIRLDTDIEVTDTSYTLMGNTRPLNDEQIGDDSYAPNLFYAHPINEKFAVGVGLYSNFGTKTEFSSQFAGNEYGGLTDVKSMNLALAGAYRATEHWSFGAGLDIIYGEGTLQRSNKAVAMHPTLGQIMPDGKLADIDADGTAFGFNTGVVYELDDKNRFGLSYRYSPDLKAEGKIRYLGQNLDSHKMVMPLPDMAEFSGFHQLTNQLAVHYSIQWINWSEFDVLETDGNVALNQYQWQDGWHYALGATYDINKDWTVRTGYMYDTSAQDEITSISVPDSDRQWLSAGVSYNIDAKSSIDLGLTYLLGEEVQVNEFKKNPLGAGNLSSVDATTQANALLLGVQYTMKFW